MVFVHRSPSLWFRYNSFHYRAKRLDICCDAYKLNISHCPSAVALILSSLIPLSKAYTLVKYSKTFRSLLLTRAERAARFIGYLGNAFVRRCWLDIADFCSIFFSASISISAEHIQETTAMRAPAVRITQRTMYAGLCPAILPLARTINAHATT